jgi:hypothetical protein
MADQAAAAPTAAESSATPHVPDPNASPQPANSNNDAGQGGNASAEQEQPGAGQGKDETGVTNTNDGSHARSGPSEPAGNQPASSSISSPRSEQSESEEDFVDPNSIHDVDGLRKELTRIQDNLRVEKMRTRRAEMMEEKIKGELEEAQKMLEIALDGDASQVTAALQRRAQDAEEKLEAALAELEDTKKRLFELEEYTDHIDEEFTALQRKMEERDAISEANGSPGGGSKVLKMLDDKNKTIDDLRSKISKMEKDRDAQNAGASGEEEEGEIPYDVLDRCVCVCVYGCNHLSRYMCLCVLCQHAYVRERCELVCIVCLHHTRMLHSIHKCVFLDT